MQIRVILGYISISVGFLGFIAFLFAGYPYVGALFSVVGMLIWLILINFGSLYGLNRTAGSVSLIAGLVISLALFLSRGINRSVVGPVEFNFDGVLISLIVLILFLAISTIHFHMFNINVKLDFLRKQLNRIEKGR